jgi:methionyl-tRNA synthetase
MKIQICVAWPYANGPRHIGHVAGFGVPSDVFARFMRMKGHNVLMVSGTDEHGTPIIIQAEAEGMQPKAFADLNNEIIVNDLQKLGLSYDLFTRTTTKNHYSVVQEIFKGLYNNGYMILQDTEVAISPSTGRTLPDRFIFGTCPKCGYDKARGDQCENCGSQLSPRELINPQTKKANGEIEIPDFTTTQHFFLDLPALKDQLADWLKTRENWRPNVIRYSLGLLQDVQPRAMSRDIDWGIPIPLPGWEDQPNKRLYVWFDAVIGYLSASIEWARRFGSSTATNSTTDTIVATDTDTTAADVTVADSNGVDGESVSSAAENKAQPQADVSTNAGESVSSATSDSVTADSVNAGERWKEWWHDPEVPSYYFMGKDNIAFHAEIWPAELLGYAGIGSKGGNLQKLGKLNLPTEIVSSEFLTMNGGKFSTSQNVVIYVKDFLAEFDADTLRYFIEVAGPESQDSNFTWEEFYQRVNSELVGNWGNLVNRTLNIVHKKFGQIPDLTVADLTKADQELLEHIEAGFEIVGDFLENSKFRAGVSQVMLLSDSVNQYLAKTQPWKETDQRRLEQIMWTACQAIANINVMFAPFLPFSSKTIYHQLGFEGSLFDVQPEIRRVPDLDDPSSEYLILTGDYQLGVNVPKWEPLPIVSGAKIDQPVPVFKKLDVKRLATSD